MTLINISVAWLYANEPHLGEGFQGGKIAQLKSQAIVPDCFAFSSKVCSQIMGQFLHLLPAARVGVSGSDLE